MFLTSIYLFHFLGDFYPIETFIETPCKFPFIAHDTISAKLTEELTARISKGLDRTKDKS